MARAHEPVRPRTLLALAMAGAAALATSEPTEVFEVVGEASWSGQLGGSAPERRRFEVRVDHPQLEGQPLQVSVSLSPLDPLVVMRSPEPEGRVAEARRDLDVEILLEETRVIELELLEGEPAPVELTVRTSYSEAQSYRGDTPPPAPDWASRALEVELVEEAATPSALNASLPPRARGPLDLRGGVTTACQERPSSLGRGRFLDVRSMRADGPVRSGSTVEVLGEGLDKVFNIWLDGVRVRRTGRHSGGDRVRFRVPPLAGPVRVVVEGEGLLGFVPGELTIEPGGVEAGERFPEGPWVGAARSARGVWLATADGEIGLAVQGDYEVVRRLSPGVEVRDLLFVDGIWLATSIGVFADRGQWLERAVDGDVRSIQPAGRSAIVAAGTPSLLTAEGPRAGFHGIEAGFVALDAHVAPCGTEDWVALTTEGELRRSTDTGKTWSSLGQLAVEARWISRAPGDHEHVLIATAEGQSFVFAVDSGELVDGPAIQRFASTPGLGLYGAGPTGLWWWNRGAWQRVASWPETRVIGLSEPSSRGLAVYTEAGEHLVP